MHACVPNKAHLDKQHEAKKTRYVCGPASVATPVQTKLETQRMKSKKILHTEYASIISSYRLAFRLSSHQMMDDGTKALIVRDGSHKMPHGPSD